jgi:hypothetical protein
MALVLVLAAAKTVCSVLSTMGPSRIGPVPTDIFAVLQAAPAVG